MGKRTWIDSDIWEDTEDLDAKSRHFYLYLLTNSRRNIAGYYKVSIKHFASDLGLSEAKVEQMLMKKQKYWLYDKATSQVLIPKFTRYNIVKSSQQIKALNAELRKLKPCSLHRAFMDAFEEINGVGSLGLIDEKFRQEANDILL